MSAATTQPGRHPGLAFPPLGAAASDIPLRRLRVATHDLADWLVFPDGSELPGADPIDSHYWLRLSDHLGVLVMREHDTYPPWSWSICVQTGTGWTNTGYGASALELRRQAVWEALDAVGRHGIDFLESVRKL
jgi:hypothetical protein